ncbi:Hsp20/alpha crystallin family protein [Hyunsoonleella rubra]|uniref:Hsp20/alpha crystallin family protein n=1 Tax=Hyunsoonleella rubra TaxID=1737062 RepID=A0ABW5T997_9FLAO
MMTTLKKRRRKRNGLSPFESQLLTPWRNNLLRPWGGRIFPSSLGNMVRFDDIFDDDFFEEESLMPAVNVKEHDEDFEIELAVPGFTKKDFEITIEDDVLHVSGEKKAEEEEKEDDYSRKEFSYKSFKRSMVLPPSVDLDQEVKATYKNGILNLKLLKKEEGSSEQPAKKIIEVN